MDALDCALALGRAPRLTAKQLRDAVQRLQEQLRDGVAATPDELLAILIGLPPRRLATLQLPEAAAAALALPDSALLAADRAWVQAEGIELVHALDSRYPPLLAQTPDAPALLYVRGNLQSLIAPQLAVVGTRNPTAPGVRTAREFAAHLARAGLVITSGLALGIDAASHEGALAGGGRTIAVLGSGLDVIYPAEHAELAARIAAHGAVVSEFAPGTPPRRAHFPQRNRIISGLTLGTLVVEAARRSGSLQTARLAAEQGREVFAIPGSIHNPLAHGCHALIKSGANLVESAPDILQELRINEYNQSVTLQLVTPAPGGDTGDGLDNDYKILLDAFGHEPASVDQLVERSGLPSPSAASMLLILELEGRVELQGDGHYMRL